MNTFNMKQWLTAHKVGPYGKAVIKENDEIDLSYNPLNKSKHAHLEKQYDEKEIVEEDEFTIGDDSYLVNYTVFYNVSYYKNNLEIDELVVGLDDIYRAEGDAYVLDRSPETKKIVEEYLNSDKKLAKISQDIEIPDTYFDDDDSRYDDYADWRYDESLSKNEQMGLGFVAKIKPSDPLRRDVGNIENNS